MKCRIDKIWPRNCKKGGEWEKPCNGLDIYKAQLTKIKNASQRSTKTSWKPPCEPPQQS